MADNVGYTPGSGATVAADDIGGVLYQRIKPVTGSDGIAIDVSQENPMPIAAYGELIEAIEALRIAVISIGRNMPLTDSMLRTRVAVETIPTISTVSTLTNAAQIGGFAGQSLIPSAMFAGTSSIRANITVT